MPWYNALSSFPSYQVQHMSSSESHDAASNQSDPLGEAHTHTPKTDAVADAEKESRSLHQKKRFWAIIAAVIALIFVVGRSSVGGAETLTQQLSRLFLDTEKTTVGAARQQEEDPSKKDAFTLASFDHHPDLLYQPYTSGPLLGGQTTSGQIALVQQFRNFLDAYVKRQAVDDNFTIRVTDARDMELLEVYTLEEERERYQDMEMANDLRHDYLFNRIDPKRKRHLRRLVDKHVRQGVPREPIMVKFGRATQVEIAQKRSRPYLEYMVRLTRYLDLSLLATQIGTVETFNNDKWVSPVGARSRFQMMPAILQRQDVNQYRLQVQGGGSILVREEWNPLLTMKPALRLMKGYANAVGHVIPGISAYHTGPGNIFKVYRYFMEKEPKWLTPRSTVMDAYMWATATNEGYQTMEQNTHFGPFSRGYVASTYGALKAIEDEPIDTSATVRAVRVQLKEGASIMLSKVLGVLEEQSAEPQPEAGRSGLAGAASETGDGARARHESLYSLFRAINPHIPLPSASESGGLVPPGGNLRLVSSVGGDDVQFFLPIGAPKRLKQAGVDVLDPDKTFRFDHDTYAYPEGERTEWDRRYDQLVSTIAQFGFTNKIRRQLFDLAEKFEELAEENPTRYRKDQLDIIQLHRQVWQTRGWERLRNVTRATFGPNHVEPQPYSMSGPLTLPRQLPS